MIKRSLIEALKNLTRSVWLSFTAISVITVSLTLVALVSTITTTVGFAVRNLDNLISIPAFIQESYPEENIPALQEKVNSISEVKSSEYFNKEKARERLENGGAGFNLDFLQNQANPEENLAWRFILVTPQTSEEYGIVINTLKSDEFTEIWEEVPGDEQFVNNLIRFNRIVSVTGMVLIVVFAMISILVMANILRITIYSHKDEIEIMRLVGATNSYIRLPFIMEGVYYNLIASAIVIVIFALLSTFIPSVVGWIGGDLSTVTSTLTVQIYFIFGLTLLAGIGVGVFTSYMATQRYLKL
jgi:cell division transport system permease protein